MKDRLSRWGIGPHIAVVTLAYAAIAGTATSRWPDVCRIRLVPPTFLAAMAILLLIAGVPMLVMSERSVMAGYNHDQLFTAGVSGLVRHPIYSAWIVFLLPALALLSRSWPQLLMPLIAYAVFKLLIHREDEYLQQRFGEAYLAYGARVNELIPIPRSWYRGLTTRNAPRARNEHQLRR
jgi:protein-S-isoprenylcysteine O-methyltransferase Ste14